MTDYRIVPAREQQIERTAAGDTYKNVLSQLRESLIQGDWTITDFEAWLELKISRCRSSRDCCTTDCNDSAAVGFDYCAKHQSDLAVDGYYDFGIPLEQRSHLDRRTVDLVGFIPMASILIAQATGNDKIWLGCTGICLYRIWSLHQ